VQNGSTEFGSSGGGGDSPRTMAWRQAMAESITANPAGETDVNDWISKRSEALADGPAHRAPSGTAAMQTIDECDSPQHSSVPWEAVAPLFENTKPWADVTDADEKKTQEKLLEIIQRGEERKMQDEKEEEDKSRNAKVHVEVDTSLSAPNVSMEPEQTLVALESSAQSLVAPQVPTPSTKASPTAVSEPTRTYAAAAKQTPKAAVKRAPAVVASSPATEVEGARSSPIEVATTEPAEVLQKPAQDMPGSTAVAPEEPASKSDKPDVEKRKKALQKKLRQISDLEKKAEDGTKLKSEELQKVAGKAALEEELKQL